MKKINLLLPLIIATSMAQAASVHAQNLILNGSFENPSTGTLSVEAPDDWTALRYNYLIPNGYSADYLPAVDGVQIDDPVNPITQNVSLTANVQYSLTFDLSTAQNSSSGENLFIDFTSADNQHTIGAPTFTVAPGTTTWQTETFDFTPTESSSYTLLMENQSGDGAVDNMVLSPVPTPEPTTLALLGFGVLIPLAVRRRRAAQRQA